MNTTKELIYIEGKNGKRYRVPIYAQTGFFDEAFRIFLSRLEYGWPMLNDDEQAIYDELYPILSEESERLEDHALEQLEDTISDDFTLCFAQKNVETLNAEELAYKMAEDLVERGFRLINVSTQPQGAMP